MTITITWQLVVAVITLLSAWTGFLLGAIKWLLKRQITALETRLEDAEGKAVKALAAVTEHKEAITRTVTEHKETVTSSLAAIRLEFSQKLTCGNHQRMEQNDRETTKQLKEISDGMHEIKGLVEGRMEGIGGALDLIQQHLLNGGK